MNFDRQLVTYDSTTVAAGALHQDLVSQKKQLKGIYDVLPPGSSAIVQFLVTADPTNFFDGTKFYHAATVLLQNSDQNKKTVSATIASYVSGKYQTEVSLRELEAPPSESTSLSYPGSNLTLANSSSKKVTVFRHPLVVEQNIDAFISMGGEKRCPQASTIAASIAQIFQDGVPLPTDQKFHHCTFRVMVHIPQISIQFLSALRGVRGTLDPQDRSGSWCSTCVDSVELNSNHPEASGLMQKFDTLKQEAKGEARPEEVPADAVPVACTTQQGAIGYLFTAAKNTLVRH